jgi:TfoX/Sxy family transcriptional regulator of competence genes
MAWKKASPEMSDLLAEAVAPFPAEMRRMFGFPAYFANGNMFTGVFEDTIILRLSDQDRAELVAVYDEAAPFEPMAGRPMREYVVLPEGLLSDAAAFHDWLERSFSWASGLPPKETKAAKAKRSEPERPPGEPRNMGRGKTG